MREWERLERTLQGRIKYAIHRRFLDQYVPEGARALDMGCGPGRFALDLARRGARVTLADLSQAQLELARQQLEAAGLLGQVDAFHCLDMVDMHELGMSTTTWWSATARRYPTPTTAMRRPCRNWSACSVRVGIC